MDEALPIIYRTLEATGLKHDEGPDKDGGYGPYIQSERCASGLYMKYAKELIDKGEAYYCFCDQERLDSLKQVVGGKQMTPGGATEIMEVIGKDETIARIEAAIAKIEAAIA